MSADLEETLGGLDGRCRDVVVRLRAARAVDYGGPSANEVRWRYVRQARLRNTCHWLIAATAIIGLAVGFLRESQATRAHHVDSAYTYAYVHSDSSRDKIVASQCADGSWGNDFLTRQNAAVLRDDPDPEHRVAYLKALRYLRAKGLRPFSDEELRSCGSLAEKFMSRDVI